MNRQNLTLLYPFTPTAGCGPVAPADSRACILERPT